MSKVKNGQYLVLVNGNVIQYLNSDHQDALQYMMTYYRQNRSKRPDAYLVQVQAMLEYPEPNITTIAHERMS